MILLYDENAFAPIYRAAKIGNGYFIKDAARIRGSNKLYFKFLTRFKISLSIR